MYGYNANEVPYLMAEPRDQLILITTEENSTYSYQLPEVHDEEPEKVSFVFISGFDDSLMSFDQEERTLTITLNPFDQTRETVYELKIGL